MYKIEITYDGGDSYNSYHDEKQCLNISWENLDIAKENLKRIESHYFTYMICHKEWNVDAKKVSETLEQAKKQDWYCDEYSGDFWKFQIFLKNDNSEMEKVSTGFYVGYFEHMTSAEIIVYEEESSDMKVTFR